jgi:hypothetical protein
MELHKILVHTRNERDILEYRLIEESSKFRILTTHTINEQPQLVNGPNVPYEDWSQAEESFNTLIDVAMRSGYTPT